MNVFIGVIHLAYVFLFMICKTFFVTSICTIDVSDQYVDFDSCELLLFVLSIGVS